MNQILKVGAGGPAFPFILTMPPGSRLCTQGDGSETVTTEQRTEVFPGMTLRQWYAGQALLGTLTSEDESYSVKGEGNLNRGQVLAKIAFNIADAMLEHERKEWEGSGYEQ